MENNRFEDSFRNAFAEAEVSPSGTVWTNIELDLEKASGGKMKRSLLMFQLLAAASVVFAFGIAALYYLDEPRKQDLGSMDFKKQVISPGSDSSDQIEDPTAKSERSADPAINEKSSGQKKQRLDQISRPVAPESSLKEQSGNSVNEYRITRNDLSAYLKTRKAGLILPEAAEERVEPDAGMVLLARLKDEEKKYQNQEKKKSNEKVWASVGFGAGSYKPNVQTSSVSLDAGFGGRSGSSSSETVGSSYSVGVNVAAKISNRFIVQGGISYLTQNANFTSTTVSNQSVALGEFMRPSNFDSYQGVSPYVVNSNMQFVSIPVQAGYLVIDRAFGLQLTGGIATDLFLRNTLSPENEDYQKVTQGAGKDSPYRTVNFSGLLGTEFSYRIADHYRISLNPGLRYSLNSIYKEQIAAEITPVTFDVSLRFRYIFK